MAQIVPVQRAKIGRRMMLTEQEIEDVAIFVMNADTFDIKRLGHDFARSIEAKVIAKIKAQGPAVSALKTEDVVKFIHKKALPMSNSWQQLYTLPEGD